MMYQLLKKLLIGCTLWLFVVMPTLLFANSFSLEVSPAQMKPGEAADMKIKVLNTDGTTNTDYRGTILMDLGQQDLNSYDFPSNGFYVFTAEDLGEKIFSKGLMIRRAGSYTLQVYDANDETMMGSVNIIVGDTTTTTIERLVDIVEPLSGSIIESSALHIVGMLDDRMVPLQFFIDGQKVSTESEADETGNFAVYLPNIEPGIRTLQVKMVDSNGDVIGESDVISFEYVVPEFDAFLQGFTLNPSGNIVAGTSVDFSAQVDGTVRSIEIKVGDIGEFIMDIASPGNFVKSVIVDQPGVHKVDVALVFEGGQRTIYEDRATLAITGNPIAIGPLRVVNNAADPSKVSVSWEINGNPNSYIVRYGISQDALTNQVSSSGLNIEIINLEIGQQYYFQVFPVDESGAVIGRSSRIASLTTQGQSVAGGSPSLSCSVVGIDIRTEKIGDKYFLVWDAMSGAVEYHIYKSDYEVSSIETMQKLGSSVVPQFEYPFDREAEEDIYTYYAVVATCSDGQNLQIDGVKKVHTGPVSDMIVLFFVSLMFYSLYRIYRMS